MAPAPVSSVLFVADSGFPAASLVTGRESMVEKTSNCYFQDN
jgi:hypothetical protein